MPTPPHPAPLQAPPANMQSSPATASELQQLQQINKPAWFCGVVKNMLRPHEQAMTQRAVNDAALREMAKLASGAAPRVVDEATRRQLNLEPMETWSEQAQIAVQLATKADVPRTMGTKARACYEYMSQELRLSYAKLAKTLRSVKEAIAEDHGAWNEAAQKEFRAVLNSVEGVMNRRLDAADAPLVHATLHPRRSLAPWDRCNASSACRAPLHPQH